MKGFRILCAVMALVLGMLVGTTALADAKPTKVEIWWYGQRATKERVAIGDYIQLSLVSKTPWGANVGTVKWKTSNRRVAQVTSTGEVYANRTGTAIITGTAGNGKKSATLKLTVFDPRRVTKLTISAPKKTLDIGETTQLSVSVAPDTADTQVSWKSSSTKIASVDADGWVTAKKKGTVTITATAKNGGKKATVKIKVNAKAYTPDPNALRAIFTASPEPYYEHNGVVTWTASASGGSGGYEYMYEGFSSDGKPFYAWESGNGQYTTETVHTSVLSAESTGGTASFRVTVRDSQGSTATATAKVTVKRSPVYSAANLITRSPFYPNDPIEVTYGAGGGTPPYRYHLKFSGPNIYHGPVIWDSGWVSGIDHTVIPPEPGEYSLSCEVLDANNYRSAYWLLITVIERNEP